MSRSQLFSSVAGPWPSAVALVVFSILGAGVFAQSADPDSAQGAEEEDFGAGDFGAPSAEDEAPQRIDLGNSASTTVITPAQAAEAASPRTVTDDDEAVDGDAAGGGGDEVFVPSEEIRVDTAIAFPVDI